MPLSKVLDSILLQNLERGLHSGCVKDEGTPIDIRKGLSNMAKNNKQYVPDNLLTVHVISMCCTEFHRDFFTCSHERKKPKEPLT